MEAQLQRLLEAYIKQEKYEKARNIIKVGKEQGYELINKGWYI